MFENVWLENITNQMLECYSIFFINNSFFLIFRCIICFVGEYSLEKGMKAKGCKRCPPETTECNSSYLILKKGYKNALPVTHF